jgi:hypothetical protein
VEVAVSPRADTVVQCRIYRPSGGEAWHYMKKLVVKGGRARMAIPFALSDEKGVWRVVARDVVTGLTRSVDLVR